MLDKLLKIPEGILSALLIGIIAVIVLAGISYSPWIILGFLIGILWWAIGCFISEFLRGEL